ncbi:prevent-host-death protein [Enterococcus sp. 669A]|uniref:Prevent-host-death protein n=1 Tax=Candidatus Enterococcus moelleringii TaxID=2815325 RepID=A0ABS3LDH5_9ENTE|nr:prevent-host-death protein [Enterococcus sp. 669A]MBO1307688.1 prevent-host-death protein [Enterococcus sp. 669A]
MKRIATEDFEKDLFSILNDAANSNTGIEIVTHLEDHVVMIPKSKWMALQEELHLHRTGTLDHVLKLMENESDNDFVEV